MDIYNSKILAVDDEKRMADEIADLLREQGYQSVHVSYGITKFADLLDDYDLAVLDIQMPRYNGIDLKNYLLRYSRKTRIVLISGYINYDVDLLNQTEGVDGCITKEALVKEPFNFIMLVNKILEQEPKAVFHLTGDDLLENITNVILELGYFFAKLGREKVCALHKALVEIPSDIHGLLYIPMDEGEGWKMRLAKEMKKAGIPAELSL